MIDVLVVGGGPAGSATARRLAMLGCSVMLAERSTFPRPHVGESLSPGVWVHFENLDVARQIERAGFRLSFETLLRWDGETRRVRAGRPSLIVDRARFDALMLDAAREAGVEIAQPVSADQIETIDGGWRVRLSDGRMIDARFLVDASGRASFSRRTRHFTAERLIAWHARWRIAHPPAETLVERCGARWLWGTTLPDGTFSAMTFGNDSAPMTETLRDSALFAWLAPIDPLEPPRASDATPYVCESPIDDRSAAVGEAAFAIDPISSSGVQAALGSGIVAAIAINTILNRSENREAAIAFYTAHVARASAQHAKWAGDSYAGGGEIESPPQVGEETLLSANADAQVIVPTIRDHFVELAPAIRTASGNEVAYLGTTALPPIVASIRPRTPAHHIVDQWSSTIGRDHAEAVLSWLVKEQAVVVEER
ncbi:MAG TPA: NAD(P)/FAD-dependent oxidoreductase [Thermoanaerobaculia bacterium]|jgi:2-polyprenyl-6-methoxyphenol hydroxylase-like FAD-dependent oxidoreductase|nr:NAD(P)/FAD-dependent oxidoreductase [Thermoanaerobaculia bacterium]